MTGRVVIALVVLLLGGCGHTAAIEVRDAVVAEPVGPTTAAYLGIENHSANVDRLLGVTTEVGVAEVHRSFSEGGTMRMEAVTDLLIGGGEEVVFEPGGLHIMLFDSSDLKNGDGVRFVLEFENAGLVEVEAVVRPYSELLP